MFKNAIITHGAMHKRLLRASITGKIGPRAGYACVAEVPKRWCDSFVVVRPCWPPPRRSRCSRLLRGGGQHQRRWHTCSFQLARDHRSQRDWHMQTPRVGVPEHRSVPSRGVHEQRGVRAALHAFSTLCNAYQTSHACNKPRTTQCRALTCLP